MIPGKTGKFGNKPLTFYGFVVQYFRYVKTVGSAKRKPCFQRAGVGGSPVAAVSQATFPVAREDRDGCSRYRAVKMFPVFRETIRVVPRVLPRPYAGGEAIFLQDRK